MIFNGTESDFKTGEDYFSSTWVQFHQRSARSFWANSLAPVKYNLERKQKKLCAKLTYIKAAGRTLVKLTPAWDKIMPLCAKRKYGDMQHSAKIILILQHNYANLYSWTKTEVHA